MFNDDGMFDKIATNEDKKFKNKVTIITWLCFVVYMCIVFGLCYLLK